MIAIEEYPAADGSSPFGAWFHGVDARAAAVVTVSPARLADGNDARVEPIGEGACEQQRTGVQPQVRVVA
jgi:hypothetical protein